MASSPLSRLLRSGAAYQLPGMLAGLIALLTIQLYTRHLESGAFATAEQLLTLIILLAIIARAGLQEALMRYWFDSGVDRAGRATLVRRVAGFAFVATTLIALLMVIFAQPISDLLLRSDQPGAVRAAALGVFAFTNLEVFNAVLRVQEARSTYVRLALANVVLTVLLTILLVVVLKQGVVGYILGNYVASALVLAVGWWLQRRVLADADSSQVPSLKRMLRFGLPIVPTDATVFALNLVDRYWLVHASAIVAVGQAQGDVYAVSAKYATIVIVLARAFQSAWPPLAYELSKSQESSAYSQVTRVYLSVMGWIAASVALLATQIASLLDERYTDVANVLPWLAIGWALWGFTWLFGTIAGRADATHKTLPAAVIALVVNVAALALLVPKYGAAGAAVALVVAYVALLVISYLRLKSLVDIRFGWQRIAAVLIGLAASYWLLNAVLPTEGIVGWTVRIAATGLLALVVIAFGGVTRRDLAAR